MAGQAGLVSVQPTARAALEFGSLNIEALAEQLTHTDDLASVHAASVALSKPGATAKAARTPHFVRALERLVHVAREGDEENRLAALAIIGRLRRQNQKPFPASVERRLAEPMDELRAAPSGLADSKERYYLAVALNLVRSERQPECLARFIASEGQQQSDARLEAAAVLLRQTADLTAAFKVLGQALAGQPHDTIDKGSSRARRLSRTLEAVQRSLHLVDPDADRSVGESFVDLIRGGLGREHIGERAASIELANATFELLAAVVRLHFSLARHAETFGAVRIVHRIFAPARWPDETSATRTTLAKLIFEAIALLAEAGVTDAQLRLLYGQLLGEPVAEARLGKFSQEGSGLNDAIRHWLATGVALRSTTGEEAAGEAVLQTIERGLAEAYREGAGLEEALTSAGEIAEALAERSPPLASAFDIIVVRMRRTMGRVLSVAAKRGFELSGEIGDAVEFRPADHEADAPLEGVRVVRIVAPKVERRLPKGPPQLVLKAKVEPK